MTAANTTVPNTSTSGTAGSDVPLPVATSSLDASVVPAASAVIQITALVDQMRAYFAMIAQALSLSVDPGTGRLRAVVESIGAPSSLGAVNASGMTVQSSAATSTFTLSNISASPAAGNKPDTLIFDAMQNAWANSAGLFVGRA